MSDEHALELVVYQPKTSLDEVLEVGAIELSDSMKPLYEQASAVTDGLFENAKVGDLAEANAICDIFNVQMTALGGATSWIGRKLSGWYEGTKRGLRAMIIKRQAIKTILEKEKANYDMRHQALRDNVATVKKIMQYAKYVSSVIERMNESLDEELAFLKQELDHQTDEDLLSKISKAILMRETIKANNIGAKFQLDVVIKQFIINLDNRETLYTTMGVFGPQLNMLLKTQLASLLSMEDVSHATQTVRNSRSNIRQASIQSARLTRRQAKETAEVAHMPVIDSATIQATTSEITGMVTDVKEALKKAIKEQQDVAIAAKKCRTEIDDSLKKLENFSAGIPEGETTTPTVVSVEPVVAEADTQAQKEEA